jgi:hypothetical protein
MLEGITIYKTLIFFLDFPIIVTFTKKALQFFFVINQCDSDFKRMMFLTKMDGYQTMFDTNKNVTKRGMIIKGV